MGRLGHLTVRMASAMALLGVCAFAAAGCGGDAQAGGGTPVVTITSGRDPTGMFSSMLASCDKRSGGKYHIEQIMLPPTSDAQREQIIRRLAAKDSSLDILGLDVIWTAEFSEAGWLYDLTERVKPRESEFIPATLTTAEYGGKYWAVPVGTNISLLFYRTDLVKHPPETWEDLVAQAKAIQKTHAGMAGFLFQANQYEGLTVDALEFLHASGGSVLGPDERGRKTTITEGDGARHAFSFMRGLFTSGLTPKTVTTFQEEESRQLFQSGNAVFLRNWTYVYNLASQPESKIRGKFAAVPLPKFEGGSSATVLGGTNYAISRFSRHPELAWQALECLAAPDLRKEKLLKQGELPTLEAIYHDPEVTKAIPYIGVVRDGLDHAISRPASPYYNDITVPIAKNVHEILTGAVSVDEGIKRLDRSVSLGAKGEGEI